MSIQCHSCIGGTNIGEDIRKLDYGQHIVSGTPGRVFGQYFFHNYKLLSYFMLLVLICILLFFLNVFDEKFIYFFSDMIKRRNLRTRAIKMLILDESDEMLNKGWCFS